MAWTAKQSANTSIEKRDEPYLTPAMTKKIKKEIMPLYATSQGALMPVLHEVQHEHGYIPWQAMVEIGALLDLSAAQVADVVSFYEDYHSEPLGRHVIGLNLQRIWLCLAFLCRSMKPTYSRLMELN